MREKIIEINNISYTYQENNKKALDAVSLDVYKGEWLSIVGHNGSGKSTLAKILNGLFYPEEGTINITNLSLEEKNIWEIRKRLGMVFQNPDNQFVGSTVEDDVAFGLENNGIPYEEMQTLVKDSLESVGMYSFLNQEPHHLSGGQKQRVAIARAIINKPKLILADEPTGNLDEKNAENVMNLFVEIVKKYNLALFMVTHNVELTKNADRIVGVDGGVVVDVL